jgi:hypothetical protein
MNQPKIFFAHRSVDKRKVEELQRELRTVIPDLGFEDLSPQVPNSTDWKDKAAMLIDRADAVVCIIGDSTHESEPVAWEVERAISANRPLLISKITPQAPLPRFISERALEWSTWDTKTLAASLSSILIRSAVFNKADDIASVLSQYAIMVQSWEALINRRQSVNQLYLSASAALVTGIGALIALSKDFAPARISVGCAILSALGLLLCWNWRRTINSYGILSTAKSKVVSALEDVLPVKLFDAEWKVLQRKMYRSTTETDMRTIAVFMTLFAIVSLISLTYYFGIWGNAANAQ